MTSIHEVIAAGRKFETLAERQAYAAGVMAYIEMDCRRSAKATREILTNPQTPAVAQALEA